jgi:hypothetical protein
MVILIYIPTNRDLISASQVARTKVWTACILLTCILKVKNEAFFTLGNERDTIPDPELSSTLYVYYIWRVNSGIFGNLRFLKILCEFFIVNILFKQERSYSKN